MDDLAELEIDCLNPVQPECMDLEFLQKTYGSKITWYGGISTQQTLPKGSPSEVKAETRRVTEILSRDGAYIISPSQHIQIDVPYENLKALIDTAKEYQ
jgi:uroporphyrinogen decarboxylase